MPVGVYQHKSPSEETRKKMSESHKGKLHSANFKKGSIPWNKELKGIHLSPKSEFKPGLKKSENAYKFQANEKHPLWKGNKVSYSGLHRWVERKRGKPNKCEFCETTLGRFEWANKSHKYKRDLEDWIRLCYKCHDKYDDVRKKSWITIKNRIIEEYKQSLCP